MSNIESFDSFNEKKNWIKDAIKKPGALKKSLGKGKDDKITKAEIDKELSKLKKKDKDDKKSGTQLNKADATKKRRLELAKTLKKVNESEEYPDLSVEQYVTLVEDIYDQASYSLSDTGKEAEGLSRILDLIDSLDEYFRKR